MARDPYEVLGVSRDATEKDITKAYHQLAWKLHPDRNPGDKDAESKFKEVQNAYEILSDPGKRSNFDRFGSPDGAKGAGFGGFSGFSGGAPHDDIMAEILRQFGAAGGGGPGGFNFEFGGEPFGQQQAGGRSRSRRRAAPAEDIEREITIPFLTAARGGKLDLQIDDQTVSVTIPAGAKEGQSLRLKGVLPGGASLKLKLNIEPHPQFRREGNDLLVEVPISLPEAVLGAKIEAPTLDGGNVTVTIPPGASSGAKLRLKGLGVAGGDQFVILKIVVPKNIDARSRELIEEFARLNPQNPRG